MSKNKQKTTQSGTTSNTAAYGQIQPDSNKYIDAYANYEGKVDPTIGFRAGASRNRLNSSFLNPAGGYQTAGMRDAMLRSGNRDIDQQVGQEYRAGAYDVNQQKQGQLGSLAALMAPRLVQTGSSGTSSGISNSEQGKNLFGNSLDVGMGAASMALM